MYIYIYVYISIYIHADIDVYIHTYLYTYIHYITLHYMTWHGMTLQYITLHYTTLHFTSLHYTALHYTTYIHMYIYVCVFILMYTYIFFNMCVDHVHCWSPGRMAIWGGFLVQGWGPLCDADTPRGSTFFYELGMVKLRVNGLLILKEAIAGGLWQHVPQYHAESLDGWFPYWFWRRRPESWN